MADRPDDRPRKAGPADDSDPRIFLIVDGKQMARPSLETFLAGAPTEKPGVTCACDPVGGTWCECNKVRVCKCVGVCSCVGHTSCSCVGHTSCSCVGHASCSCVGHSSRGGGCRCAPVH